MVATQNLQHSFVIDASPAHVFDCICRPAEWWKQDIAGTADTLGAEFTVTFLDTLVDFKISELVPNRTVSWFATRSYLPWLKDTDEWTETTVKFDLEEVTQGTKVTLTHIGLTPEVECFEGCKDGWGRFFCGSLFELITKGQGTPAEADVQAMDIVPGSKEKAFEAICRVSEWWSDDFEGATQAVGDSFTLRLRDAHFSTFKVTKIFGLENLDLAEDVTQDAFRRALEVWSVRGVPENPSGWLLATAKNRALDVLRRERRTRSFSPEYGELLRSEWTLEPLLDELLAAETFGDDQLRLMFSCCHPRVPAEAQTALMLHYLCGFGVREIAEAYLSPSATLEKRIGRAKKVLSASGTLFRIAERSEFELRLPSVERALYLLFNQGYHGASTDAPIQPLLCQEALRLAMLLVESRYGQSSRTMALAALMLLNAARLPSRLSRSGELQRLAHQDRTLWDRDSISRGLELLDRACQGQQISEYHFEAMIAALHSQAETAVETDWPEIVHLYDGLFTLKPTPVVALNRAIAIGQRDGPKRGLEAISAIPDPSRLESYPFYWAAQGEFHADLTQTEDAIFFFKKALSTARNPIEKQYINCRLDLLQVRLHL